MTRKDVTYIVSGHFRTGTSMMMEALIAGGMEAAYDASSPYFELPEEAHRAPHFPQGYEGGLIKVFFQELPRLHPGFYRIIFMMRDPKAIAQSVRNYLKVEPWPLEKYFDVMGYCIYRVARRTDVLSFDVFDYPSVVHSPGAFFERLWRAGWPIDWKQAMRVVKTDKQHYGREMLNHEDSTQHVHQC